MKAMIFLVFFCLLLAIGVPYSADAFGSYSNDQLNTTNTEQNITFNTTELSELVYITIPRRANITTATWNITGRAISTFTDEQNVGAGGGLTMLGGCSPATSCTSRICQNKSISGTTYVNRLWFKVAQGGTPAGDVNFTIRNGTSTDIISSRTWGASTDLTPATPTWENMSFNNIEVSGYILYCVEYDGPNRIQAMGESSNVTTGYRVIYNDTGENWITQTGFDFTYNISYAETFPENITIDTGNNGETDYTFAGVMNGSNSPVTADLNETAINNYLHDTCTADWTTGTCDVPLNISVDSNGTVVISTISIIGEFIFGVFNVSILDEITGDAFNISGSDSVVLSFFCANETQNVTITSQGQEVDVLCVVDEVRITVTEAADEIIRYLVPTSNLGELNFYVYNSTEETDVIQNWLYFDVTGIYENGIVVVTKVIFDLGERTMIEKIIDSESKTTLYLVVGEKYCFSVFDSNRENERDLGCMDADADTVKRISISTIPFSPDQAIAYEDVFVTFSWDKTTEIIQALYNDTLDETNSVTFTVYNATNSSHILFTSTSTLSVVTFTFNNVDTNGTYVARIVADHQRYGIIDPMVTIDFGGKYKVAGLEALDLGIWMSIAGGMISTLVMLAFGKRYAKIGSAVFVFMILMFMQWGWFDASPQLGWGMLTLIAFIVFGNVMTLRRRLQ